MKLSQSSIERVVQCFRDVDLGDPRRTKRLERVAAKIARAPSESLPSALGCDSEVQGAYRLANNPCVTFEDLLGAQQEVTRRRAEDSGRVLVLHDTTDAKFPHHDANELGYLNTGKVGFRVHLSLVVDADEWRRPLGIAYAETIHRSKRRRGRKKPSGPTTATWKNKEFERWWRGMQASSEALAQCESVIHVADREGDSYDLMHKLLAAEQQFVIRMRVDRRGRKADEESEGWSTIKKVAACAEGLVQRDVPLTRRKAKGAPAKKRTHPPRKKRIAKLQFAATQIEIPRPQYLREPVPKSLKLNLVHVVEVDTPPGEPAVEWLLYTTEPVDTAEQVEAVVDVYRTRWLIEEFNSALKTGTSYEARQFETKHALLNMLALSLPVACEILWIRSRARSTPNSQATEVLTRQQLRVLRALGSYKLPRSPTAQDALLAVAALGGHLKRNGPPGWKILQRGMTKLINYETAWTAAEAARK